MILLEFDLPLPRTKGQGPSVAARLPSRSVLEVKGPSGVGKSTLLRLIARLDAPPGRNAPLPRNRASALAPRLEAGSPISHQQPFSSPEPSRRTCSIPCPGASAEARPTEGLSSHARDAGPRRETPRTGLAPPPLGGEKKPRRPCRSFLADPVSSCRRSSRASPNEDNRRLLLLLLREWLDGADRGLVLDSHRDDGAFFRQGMSLDMTALREVSSSMIGAPIIATACSFSLPSLFCRSLSDLLGWGCSVPPLGASGLFFNFPLIGYVWLFFTSKAPRRRRVVTAMTASPRSGDGTTPPSANPSPT
jgi:energy-coupling factor transporter ATP-binding protein EcfA2